MDFNLEPFYDFSWSELRIFLNVAFGLQTMYRYSQDVETDTCLCSYSHKFVLYCYYYYYYYYCQFSIKISRKKSKVRKCQDVFIDSVNISSLHFLQIVTVLQTVCGIEAFSKKTQRDIGPTWLDLVIACTLVSSLRILRRRRRQTQKM